MPRLALPLHSYQLRSRPESSARLVNCFIEPLGPNAKVPYALMRAPGIAAWTTVGTGPIRAMHVALGYLWVVSGQELYRVSAAKTATLIGNVGSSLRYDIDSNISSIVVVAEPNAYYYDTTSSTFSTVTDADFTARGAADVEFLDNFMLFREPDSGRFFCADVGSVTSYDGLNFATAESAPDKLVGLKRDHSEALLFGENSTEIWQLVGGSGFPFSRAANGVIEMGCANGATIEKLDNSVFWLASDLTVRRMDGVNPVRVSHVGIEQSITSMTLSSAKAFTYTQEGHLFYVLSFTEGTFTFDVTTKEWHERQSYGYDNWRAGCQVQFNTLKLVGDVTSNKIGYVSPTTFAEWGDIQRMEWTYQPVYAQNEAVFHDRLEIVCETGVGLSGGQGSDPQMLMDVSDDGGRSFDALPSVGMGAIGRSETIVNWAQLGSSPDRVYRGAVTDPVAVAIYDTQLTARGARPFSKAAA